MNSLEQILQHNRQFVEKKEYLQFNTTNKYPAKDMVIISCMDTRLTELLPRAMNIANGDAKIIKVAGAVINHPFGSVMRSIIIAVHVLGAEEIFIVGHTDCGMAAIQTETLVEKMINDGIEEKTIKLLEHSGIKMNSWLKGFDCIESSIKSSVNMVKNHPLITKNVVVSGLIIDSSTGFLQTVVDGFKEEKR